MGAGISGLLGETRERPEKGRGDDMGGVIAGVAWPTRLSLDSLIVSLPLIPPVRPPQISGQVSKVTDDHLIGIPFSLRVCFK